MLLPRDVEETHSGPSWGLARINRPAAGLWQEPPRSMGLKFSCGVGFLLLAALWQQQVMFPIAAVVVVVVVAVGDDAVLPCNLAPPFSKGRMLTVEWKRVDVLPTVTLLANREGKTLDRERGQAYAGRTSLGGDGRSVRLANAGRHDQGTYRWEESLRPLITLTRVQGRELLLGCEARDWFPEPEVSWQDGEGGVLPSDPPVIQRNHSHNLYSVSTNLNITAVTQYGNVLDVDTTGASDAHSREGRAEEDGVAVREYGNVLDVDTTGASDAHSLEGRAEEDGVAVRGVTASQVFARRDLEEMKKYRKIILNVADRLSIHPCLIAAIISRQSRAGLDLRPNGYGKYDSTCHGLMQVNEAYHPLQPDAYGEEHIHIGTIVLIQAIKSIKQAMENSWNKNQILKGGIAAYIIDAHLVGDHYEELDARTPYEDFSNDVVARAQFYADNGFA
ncbi:unnamed protein product [Merluccius merluccius]